MYTTVEGLLTKIHQSLREHHSYQTGDSKTQTHSLDHSVTQAKDKFNEFLEKLLQCAKGERLPFTLQLHDPFGNSFISAPLGTFLPLEEDAHLELVDFVRTDEEVT